MKKLIIILTIIAAPWYLSAQSMTIGDGAVVTIGVGASASYGTAASSGAITSDANTKLIIKSTSSGSGSLICGGTPNATVERYVTTTRWNMVTPSTTGTTGQTFFDASGNDSWLSWFDESIGTHGSTTTGEGWEYITNLGDVVNVGQGYSYWPDVNETVEFKGNLQSASKDINLANSGSTHGYNLIGNVFSSSLAWDGSGWSFNSVEQTIWIWNGSTYNSYPYASAPHEIAVGQGFFMRASSATTITLPADKRIHSSTNTFLKSSENELIEGINYLKIKAQNNQYEDKIYITFGDEGTEGFDNGYDATKIFGIEESPQLYLVEGDLNQSFDHLPTLVEGEERTVAMSYISGAEGEQVLITDFTYFTGAEVTLEDLKTGDTHNLGDNPVYTFTGSKDDSPERFLLHFAWSPDGIDDDIENASSNINIYAYGNEVYIRSSEEAIMQKGNVFVYDLMGRELAQHTIEGTELIKFPVNTTNNYVVVKVVKDGSTKIQKVYIK